MNSKWFFLSIIGVVIVMLFFIGYFDSLEDFTGGKEDTREVPDVHFTKFHTDNFRFQHKNWELQADSGVGYEKYGKVDLNNVVLYFFKEETKKKSSKVIAQKVVLYKKEKRLIFMGDVQISSEDGSVLKGEEFVWDDQQQQISTVGFAKIERPNGDVIKGTGLKSDKNLDNVVFDRNVSGTKVNIQR